MKYVIFDFNGTVLDDVDVSRRSLNSCIEKYLDRKPVELEEYLQIFTFPIKKYYENAGFNFDNLVWEEVGKCWMDYYMSHKHETKVHDGIIDFLINNHKLGNKNILLSASKLDNLLVQLDELNIREYFDEVLGIDNIYAESKIPIGLKFIEGKNKEDCIMIGDTSHDVEVSRAMGIKCILIAKGHQGRCIIDKCGVPVYESIYEVTL